MNEPRNRSRFSPEGWHTVTPRIVVHGAQQMVEFIKQVFGGTGDYSPDRPAVIHIGDSMVMISDAGIRNPTPAFLYLYVDDTDKIYLRALQAGASSLEEPSDTHYGDRRGMVIDKWGNTWQIATHLGDRDDVSIAKPQFQTIAPQFTVPDVVATARYYSDVLGFETRGFFGEPPVFSIVTRGPIEIFFNQDPNSLGKPRVRAAGAYDAYIFLSGVDAFVTELRSRGARIIEGPVDRVYGMREIVIEDCNSLRLAFGEDRAKRTT